MVKWGFGGESHQKVSTKQPEVAYWLAQLRMTVAWFDVPEIKAFAFVALALLCRSGSPVQPHRTSTTERVESSGKRLSARWKVRPKSKCTCVSAFLLALFFIVCLWKARVIWFGFAFLSQFQMCFSFPSRCSCCTAPRVAIFSFPRGKEMKWISTRHERKLLRVVQRTERLWLMASALRGPKTEKLMEHKSTRLTYMRMLFSGLFSHCPRVNNLAELCPWSDINRDDWGSRKSLKYSCRRPSVDSRAEPESNFFSCPNSLPIIASLFDEQHREHNEHGTEEPRIQHVIAKLKHRFFTRHENF